MLNEKNVSIDSLINKFEQLDVNSSKSLLANDLHDIYEEAYRIIKLIERCKKIETKKAFKKILDELYDGLVIHLPGHIKGLNRSWYEISYKSDEYISDKQFQVIDKALDVLVRPDKYKLVSKGLSEEL